MNTIRKNAYNYMKKNLIIVSLIFASMILSVSANEYNYRVIRVLDGDTVEIDAPFLPVELKQVLKLRIEGVDTPEKGSRAACESERIKADYATDFTKRVVGMSKKHSVLIQGWDKYGGRILGDVLLDGKSLKNMLIDSGYAKPYDGGKKTSWC